MRKLGRLEERLRKFGRCTFQKKRMDGQRTGHKLFFIHLTDASPKQGVDEGLILFSLVS